MANLTYTVKETVTINGKVVGNEIVKTVSGVNRYQQYTMTIPTSPTSSVVEFGAAAEYGTVKDGDLEYIRITNLDGTNFITLSFGNGTDTASIRLEAGGSFILTSDTLNGVQLNYIKGQADTADCEIEVFIGIA
jgi:hypothetical protein